MKKNFIQTLLLALLFIGCGSSNDSDSSSSSSSPNSNGLLGNNSNSNTQQENSNSNTSYTAKELSNYDEIGLIYRATKDFCVANNILSEVKNSNQVLDYVVATTTQTPDCAKFGKTSDHCDTFIAEGEPGNITCIIAFNVR